MLLKSPVLPDFFYYCYFNEQLFFLHPFLFLYISHLLGPDGTCLTINI
jgi:hypothetical protein